MPPRGPRLPPFVSFWDDDDVDNDDADCGSEGASLVVVARTTGMVLVDRWFMMLLTNATKINYGNGMRTASPEPFFPVLGTGTYTVNDESSRRFDESYESGGRLDVSGNDIRILAGTRNGEKIDESILHLLSLELRDFG